MCAMLETPPTTTCSIIFRLCVLLQNHLLFVYPTAVFLLPLAFTRLKAMFLLHTPLVRMSVCAAEG